MRTFRHTHVDSSEIFINLTSMIDVVLTMLIFFLLTAGLTSSMKGLPVDLPSASSDAAQVSDAPVVTLTLSGDLYLDAVAVSQADLGPRLHALLAANPSRGDLVMLRSDRGASVGLAVQVMEVLRQAGAQRIAVVTAEPSQ